MRLAVCLAALTIAAAPATAQDVLGPVNPVDYTGPIALGAALEGQVKADGENFRGTGFSESYVREQCAGLPRDRSVLGPKHRRVVRWTAICRKAALIR